MLSGQPPWSDIPFVVRNHDPPFQKGINEQYLSFLRDTSVKGVVDRLAQNHVPPLPQNISEQDLSFLRQCFSLRPADRPSTDEILAFVRGESLRCITGTTRTAAGVVRLLSLCSW